MPTSSTSALKKELDAAVRQARKRLPSPPSRCPGDCAWHVTALAYSRCRAIKPAACAVQSAAQAVQARRLSPAMQSTHLLGGAPL